MAYIATRVTNGKPKAKAAPKTKKPKAAKALKARRRRNPGTAARRANPKTAIDIQSIGIKAAFVVGGAAASKFVRENVEELAAKVGLDDPTMRGMGKLGFVLLAVGVADHYAGSKAMKDYPLELGIASALGSTVESAIDDLRGGKSALPANGATYWERQTPAMGSAPYVEIDTERAPASSDGMGCGDGMGSTATRQLPAVVEEQPEYFYESEQPVLI